MISTCMGINWGGGGGGRSYICWLHASLFCWKHPHQHTSSPVIPAKPEGPGLMLGQSDDSESGNDGTTLSTALKSLAGFMHVGTPGSLSPMCL